MRKIFKAVFIITLFSILTRIGGFLFRIYLTKVIGAGGMGLYQITMSVFGLLVALTSSGLPLVISRRTAEMEAVKNKKGASGSIAAALIIGLSVSAAAVLLIFIGQDFVAKIFSDNRNLDMLLVLLPAVVVSSFYSAFRGGLWGQKKFFSYGLIEFFEQYMRIGIGVIMLQGVLTLTQGTMRAAISLSVSYVAAAAIAAIIYFAAGGRLASPREHFKPVLKSAAPITLIRIAGNLLTTLIALIVPLRLIAYGLGQDEALAQFGAAAGMALPLISIPITLVSSLASALVPEISGAGAAKDSKKLSADVNNAIRISIVLGGMFVAFFIVAGPDISKLIYDNALAGEIIRLGAITVIPSALALIAGSMLNSLGLEFKSLKCYIISSAVLLITTWFLPSLMGIGGMIIASVVSVTLTCVLDIMMLNKVVPVGKSTAKSMLATLLLVVPVTLTCYFLYGLLVSVMPVVAAILIIGVVSVGLYILFCYTFNLLDIEGIFRIIKNRRKKTADR